MNPSNSMSQILSKSLDQGPKCSDDTHLRLRAIRPRGGALPFPFDAQSDIEAKTLPLAIDNLTPNKPGDHAEVSANGLRPFQTALRRLL